FIYEIQAKVYLIHRILEQVLKILQGDRPRDNREIPCSEQMAARPLLYHSEHTGLPAPGERKGKLRVQCKPASCAPDMHEVQRHCECRPYRKAFHIIHDGRPACIQLPKEGLLERQD